MPLRPTATSRRRARPRRAATRSRRWRSRPAPRPRRSKPSPRRSARRERSSPGRGRRCRRPARAAASRAPCPRSAGVRDREHLFGRQVRHVELAPRGLGARRDPVRRRHAGRRSGRCRGRGSGPRRSGARSAAARAPGASRCAPSRRRPGRARRGARSRGPRPRAARRRARRTPARPSPASGRRRSSTGIRPWSNADQSARRSSGISDLVDPVGVEAGEEVRVGLADGVDHRRPPLGLLLDPLEHPRRHPADRVVRRELGRRAAQVDVHGRCGSTRRAPSCVGDARDRPDERRVLDVAEHDDVLAGLEVDPDRSASRAYSSSSSVRSPQNAAFVHGSDAITVESSDGERAQPHRPPRPRASG